MAQTKARPGEPVRQHPEITSDVRRAAWLSAGALIAIAITVAALSYFEAGTRQWVQRAERVSRSAGAALRLAVDAETGVRGYLVTHDRRSLEPELSARFRLGATLDSLQRLTAANATQHAAAVALTTAIDDWFAKFADPIVAAGLATGNEEARVLAGKLLFDRVRLRANALITSEDALYIERSVQSQRLHWAATAAVCFEILFVLAGLAWLARRIIHEAKEVERQQHALEQQAVELEEQAAELQEQTSALGAANQELAESVKDAEESRARAEREARQKARLAALLDAALASSPIGFGFFDRELRFLRVNTMLARVHGLAEEDHIGHTLREIDARLADDVEPFLRRVLAAREPIMNVELRGPGSGEDRTPHDWLSSFFPMLTPEGDLFGVGVAVTDVTALKKLEGQLLQAQKMEAVGRLAGGVAHDFNNLLTVINSYAELMLFDPEMEHGKEQVQEIRGAAARAAKLTRQLLAFSRRQAMEPRIVNPNDVLRGVETLLRRLVVGNVTIKTMLSPETPLIRVDPGQLEQVVMNLAINAADAMPEGGTLTIETSSAALGDDVREQDPDVAPGSYALVQVRDTGHGMDAETAAQIFEPFFTTKEPGRGTGLGLSTVYGIVKQSSGHIALHTEVGAGTVFSVYLPAVGEEEGRAE